MCVVHMFVCCIPVCGCMFLSVCGVGVCGTCAGSICSVYMCVVWECGVDVVGVVSRCTTQTMARALTELKVKVLPHYTIGIHYIRESCKYCMDHAFGIMHLVSCISWLNCYRVIFGDLLTDLVTGNVLCKDLHLQLLM